MRRIRLYILYLVVLAFLSSCVTNKKFQILQKNDLNKDMKKDSILRSYETVQFDYKIQPHDVLTVRFESLTPTEFDFLNRNLTTGVMANPAAAAFFGEMVNDQGELTYPVIGTVVVSGLTIFEVQAKLQTLADEYLDSPKVIVRLVNFRVTLMGEVNHEGQVSLTNNRVTMLEAIALGGGMGELADRSNVKLVRQTGNTVSVQYIDLRDENFITSPYYYVNQNDIIVVPPLKQRAFRKYFGPNLGLITSSVAMLLLAINFINQQQN